MRCMKPIVLGLPLLCLCLASPAATPPKRAATGPAAADVSLKLVATPLYIAAAELSAQTHQQVTVANWAKDRPFTILCNHTPAASILSALAWATRGRWVRLKTGGICLQPDSGTLALEQNQIQERKTWIRNRVWKREATIQRNVDAAPRDSIVATIWQSLSQEQQKAVIGTAVLHVGASGADFTQLRKNIIGDVHYDSLSPELQETVKEQLGGMLALGNMTPRTNLSSFTLGFCWSTSQLNVGGYTHGHKGWVSGTMPLLQSNSATFLLGKDGALIASDGCNAEREKARVDLFTPYSHGRWTSTFVVPQNIDFNPAPIDTVLQLIYKKTHVPIVSDGYMGPQLEYPFSFLAGKLYTLQSILLPLARSTGHHIILFQDVLALRTLTLGRDLLAEPPATLLTKYLAWVKGKAHLTLKDFEKLSSLSNDAFHGIAARTLEITHVQSQNIGWPVSMRAFLRRLTVAQWKQAQTANGLPLSSMSPIEQRTFLLTALMGARPQTARGSTPPEGFAITVNGPNNMPQSIDLHFRAAGPPVVSRTWRWNSAFPGTMEEITEAANTSHG